jgi:hypothetical protein
MKYRSQIENQVNDYRLLDSSSLGLKITDLEYYMHLFMQQL